MNRMCPESLLDADAAVMPDWACEIAVRCPNCKKRASIYVYGLHPEKEYAVSCMNCAHRKPHIIKWPADAYYQVKVSGAVLWAWTRKHMVEIRDYVASEDRGKRKYPHHEWKHVRRIPARFLDVKRRAAVVRAIDRVLAKA